MKTKQFKYIFLALTCMAAFSNYFILDSPALLKPQIINQLEQQMSKNNAEVYFSLLYSIYSLPNILLPLISGLLIDMYGDQIMTLIFSFLILAGWIFFSLGLQVNMVYLMILGTLQIQGRFFQGLGGESQAISIQTMTIRWFQGDNLTFSQAIQLSFFRIASIANAVITPILSAKYNMLASVYFGVLVCCISLAACLCLVYLDLTYYPKDISEKQSIDLRNIAQIWGQLSKLFKYISIVATILYMTQQTFNMFTSDLIIQTHLSQHNSVELNQELAGRLITIPLLISVFLSPMLGLLVDNNGQRLRLLYLSFFTMFLGFASFLYSNPLISLTFIGIDFALFSTVIWPTVSYCVPTKYMGLALGLITAMVNFGCMITPVVVITIKNYMGGVEFIIFQLLIIVLVGIIFMIKASYEDAKNDVSLDSSNQIKLLEQLDKMKSISNSVINEDQKQENALDCEDNILDENIKLVGYGK